MNRKLWMLLLFLLGTIGQMQAFVEHLKVYSEAMDKDIDVVAVLPGNYDQSGNTRYRVVYLLHGYGNEGKQWIEVTKPNLEEVATETGFIFICPSGNNSWYWDSPVDPAYRYETFVSDELIRFVDHKYATVAHKTGRAITGYSMGGHGALWLAIRHSDRFGAVGCMSGGVDIRPFPDGWEMKNRLGDYADNKEVWDQHTVITQVDKIENDSLAIIIDCGFDDFFLQVNKNLHEELLKRKINHDFILRPGVHDHSYWNGALDYQLFFFKKYFDSHRTE